MPQFKKILCPVDFDPNSLLALRLASELAQEGKATLHLLHVVAMPPGPEVALPFGKTETAARTRLEQLARIRIPEKVSYKVEVTIGDPAIEVLQAAKSLQADLIIVMATHVGGAASFRSRERGRTCRAGSAVSCADSQTAERAGDVIANADQETQTELTNAWCQLRRFAACRASSRTWLDVADRMVLCSNEEETICISAHL